MTNEESVKDMTSKFDKLIKFEGQNFRRWQKKMHFLLTTLKVVYVPSTPSPVWSENETLKMTRKRMKWENDNYICRGHILNAVMEQYHEMLRILRQYTQHNLMMDEAISVAVIIDKLPPSRKEFKHGLKHKKEELNLVQLDSHLRIEEGLRNKELDNNPKGKNQIGSSSVNMVERDGAKNSNHNKNKRKFKSVTCWKCKKTGHMKKDCRSRKGNDDAGSNGSKDPEKQQGGEYYDPVYFQSTGIIHQTTAPYTPQQNGVDERKNRTLKEMVNSMLSYSGLSERFWGEAMLTACYILNRTPNKNSKQTPYEIWTKKVPNLTYLRIWGCRAVVRLTEPKMKNLGEKGIDCIFIGYAEHSKCYYVIEPNDYVSVNSIIESRDAIFDEERFTSIPRPRGMIQPSSSKIAEDEVEGTRDKTLSQREYCFIIEEDPRTLSEAMASRDVAFWKEAVQSEIDSIMHNDTGELTDLPHGCKALRCKWILKKKMKVDGSIDKYKARLVIQGFRQKEGIDFFDTYAPVARIFTIRLLLALAIIHDLVRFVMPGHESKVCKLKKSLYGLKEAPKQWHQTFNDVVLSNDFSLNQADKCVYSKFDASGKGVIICLYVDDMLIFGTDQDQVNKTNEFLSSKFDMKDLGKAEVILGVRIKRGNNGISISQSHYIEKILTKFNLANCSPVYPVDPIVKFRHNKGTPVSQLEYSRAIGCLMYAMISPRPDIAFAVGKLSRYTSNPSALHWPALGYSNAIWINNMEDYSSTSGWIFFLEEVLFLGLQRNRLVLQAQP
nr:retrotransposon protein, putative, Ty1-copia subclass [Tanacetum cinerariifolium]